MTDQPPLPEQEPLPDLPVIGEELLAETEHQDWGPAAEQVDLRWHDQLNVGYDDGHR